MEKERSLADFFQDQAKIGIFNLPVALRDQEELFESTRIYMESGEGRPFNYLKSEEEVAEELLVKQQENWKSEAEKDAEAEKAKLGGSDVCKVADTKRHQERMRIIAEHQAKQKELEALPLREYLMRYMVPSLTEGLIEMCKVVPEDPVDYLATYLEQHAASEQSEN